MARPSFRIGDLGNVVYEEPAVLAESSFSVRFGTEPKDCIIDLLCPRNVGCGCKFYKGCPSDRSDDCPRYKENDCPHNPCCSCDNN